MFLQISLLTGKLVSFQGRGHILVLDFVDATPEKVSQKCIGVVSVGCFYTLMPQLRAAGRADRQEPQCSPRVCSAACVAGLVLQCPAAWCYVTWRAMLDKGHLACCLSGVNVVCSSSPVSTRYQCRLCLQDFLQRQELLVFVSNVASAQPVPVPLPPVVLVDLSGAEGMLAGRAPLLHHASTLSALSA